MNDIDQPAVSETEPKPKSLFRNVWFQRGLWAVLIGVACHQVWRHGSDYVFPEKFATVEPGKLYRGAWQQDWPMRRLVSDYKIQTILALAHKADNPMAIKEKALATELGCRWVHIPIVDDRSIGNSESLFDRLEEAANVLASQENQPVYFHCHHGINRASMVQMAYRMLHCGWTLDEATDEISRNFGLRAVNKGPDYRHMTRFYEERVLKKRDLAMRGSQ